MKRLFTIAFISLAFFSAFQTSAQTPVPMASQPGLSYTENFSDIANWTNGFAAGVGANRFGSVGLLNGVGIPNPQRVTTTSVVFVSGTSGGLQRGSSAGNPPGTIVLLATGATDNLSSVAIDFFMDFSGVNAGTLSFDWASVNNTTGDRNASFRVYATVDGNNFVEVSGAEVLNFTNNLPSNGSRINVALPAIFNNNANARLRLYIYNGTGGTTGSRPKISVDNLNVTASAIANPGVISWTEQFPSASESTGVANFTVQRTGGSSGTVMVDVTPSGLGATGGAACTGTVDFVDTPFTLTFNDGETSKPVNIQVCNDALFEGNEVFNMILSNPTNGATLGSPFISQYTILDDDIPSVQMSAAAYSGDEGTNVTVTITRTGATNASADVNYSTSGGTSTAGTCGTAGADYVPQSGTANFGIGVTQISLDIVLCGDLYSENPAETFNFNIDSAISATVGSPATATVTIRDAATQFTNTANILIPSGGNGSIYPSTIAVSGFSTIISGLRVTLAGLTHTSPDDLRVLLVSPTGQSMVIMSGTGGLNDLNDTTITFEDFAASGLPDNTAISNGQNYKPTGCGTIDPFPAPAPGSGYALPGCPPPVSPGGAPTLATTFGGFNPNGNWSLYLVDSGLNPVAAGGNSLSGWGLQFFGPTAANVSLNGRVMTANGQGIRDAVVTIDGDGLSAPRRMRTVTFGYFRFDDLSSGQTYIVTVNSRRYAFAVPTRLVTLEDNVSDFDFAAEPRD